MAPDEVRDRQLVPLESLTHTLQITYVGDYKVSRRPGLKLLSSDVTPVLSGSPMQLLFFPLANNPTKNYYFSHRVCVS